MIDNTVWRILLEKLTHVLVDISYKSDMLSNIDLQNGVRWMYILFIHPFAYSFTLCFSFLFCVSTLRSVMSECFRGLNLYWALSIALAQRHKLVTQVALKLATTRSQVELSTMSPLRTPLTFAAWRAFYILHHTIWLFWPDQNVYVKPQSGSFKNK